MEKDWKRRLKGLIPNTFSSYFVCDIATAGFHDVVAWKNDDGTFRVLILTDGANKTHDHYSESATIELFTRLVDGDLSQIRKITS